MGGDGKHSVEVGKRRKIGRKGSKGNGGFHEDTETKNQSGDVSGASGKGRGFSKDKTASVSQASFIRKQVDPETTKYFSEIANVIEGAELDLEERSVICCNALESASGKEVELVTDYIISHTMQTLLEGCSVDVLCSFLRSCAKDFSYISTDRSGSHVAETALKSLATHLGDEENYSLIKTTLSALCQAIAANTFDTMCNSYGSHVLRRLLCLCKGVPVDSTEFHRKNPSVILAERLNLKPSYSDAHDSQRNQPFPELLKFLIAEMLKNAKADVETILVNQYSSLVLQTILKLLVGQEDELLQVIPVLLDCPVDISVEGIQTQGRTVKKILRLVEENAYSHLMEVILAVAPDTLYCKVLEIFKGSLFKMSSHGSANFVVQALISHARSQDHIKLIFEELGSKFYNLLELGRAGVIAALVAASQRLQILETACCQALVDSVCLKDEPPSCIVPRILFLDHYLLAADKANWTWPNGARMHVLGSLILQSVFRFPSESIQAYITSIISFEEEHALEASKDPAGARVIEAFLSSNASAKQKRKLVIRLQGHFGELSMLHSGSFTVEKCFNVSNLSLREAIVSELLSAQAELSKTKQGPYLLKKLDVEGYARRPDQWRSRQTSKQSTYKEFYATFGTQDTKSSKSENFLADIHNNSQAENFKGMRKEIEIRLNSGVSSGSVAPFLAHQSSMKSKGSRYKQAPKGGSFAQNVDNSRKSKRQKIEQS